MHRHLISLPRHLAGVARSAPPVSPAPAPEPMLAERALAAPEAATTQALNGMLDSLASVIDSARQQRQGTIACLASQSVELGVAIAERLLGAAITLDRQRLDLIVLTSLERLPPTNTVALRGHPADIALLQRQLEENETLGRWRETFTFQQDETCVRGRLILETGDLFVEWDTQRSLAEMRGLLLDQIFTEA